MESAARDGPYLSLDPSWLEACRAVGDDPDAILAQNIAAYDILGGQGERNRKRERSSSTEEESQLHHADQGERSALRAHEGKVPCEFCSSLLSFDGIMPHQVKCIKRFDLETAETSQRTASSCPHLLTDTSLEQHSDLLKDTGYDETDEAIIPCEFCGDAFPESCVTLHQGLCEKNPNSCSTSTSTSASVVATQHDEDIARLLQTEYDEEWDAEIARQLQEQYDDASMAVPSGTTQHHGVRTMELPLMSTLGNQDFGKEVATLSEEVYSKLTSTTPNADKLRKALAAVVMRKNNQLSLVALGTGTKCIRGRCLSKYGDAVNDCHAEVVARRAFIKYLYVQLRHCVEERESIFAKTTMPGKCILKHDISFHLYISTAPCGDARTFGTESDAHPNRASRGLARVKIEAGEGSVLPQKEVPVWESLTKGKQRLCTMSCSDKLARWNVLGVQGSLLSIYIDPIYFASITLGSAFNYEHLLRAVYTRVKMVSDLPHHYIVKRPTLCDGSSLQPPCHITPKKSSKLSLNWYNDKDAHLEAVDCQTGRQSQVRRSRLCKHSLFQDFIQLWDKLIPDGTETAEHLQIYSYGQVKSLATDYQVAKEKLFNCYRLQCGSRWIKKPHQQDDFTI